ncbi:hypothetical protein E5F05_16320 [Deinococcus metallilatus]|nr:hypothetical protein [Deinococcus metallilatus]QBY09366.1 hypothetical protein E5F05_16320 [Deinococcus metallilatus]GMA16856.1 hypothetical protein GCM10025871_31870 [Deinococcus metallilatus]
MGTSLADERAMQLRWSELNLGSMNGALEGIDLGDHWWNVPAGQWRQINAYSGEAGQSPIVISPAGWLVFNDRRRLDREREFNRRLYLHHLERAVHQVGLAHPLWALERAGGNWCTDGQREAELSAASALVAYSLIRSARGQEAERLALVPPGIPHMTDLTQALELLQSGTVRAADIEPHGPSLALSRRIPSGVAGRGPGRIEERLRSLERAANTGKCKLSEVDALRSFWQARREARQRGIHDQLRASIERVGTRTLDEVPGLREARAASPPPSRAQLAWRDFRESFPLLGPILAGMTLCEDPEVCRRLDIRIGAVAVERGVIYINPGAGLSLEEARFVIAHEALHVALGHHERRQGRDPELFNIACDLMINAWLTEMRFGVMPAGGCLDSDLAALGSAEAIYSKLARNVRLARRLQTLRGSGEDILDGDERYARLLNRAEQGSSVAHDHDSILLERLRRGLAEMEALQMRGLLPAGLDRLIRQRAAHGVPWRVELARYLGQHFRPGDTRRSYGRASRRQGSTPDLIRPACVVDQEREAQVLGVLIDTSGSMDERTLGLALGALSTTAQTLDIDLFRVVTCDAGAHDLGWRSPWAAGSGVTLVGGGGTVLQPGVDLIRTAKDVPADMPLLIITDGYFEPELHVPGEHAWLLDSHGELAIPTRAPVFRIRAR